MKIITVPHPTLRTVAQPITTVDKKLRKFIVELGETLAKKDNPKGVGLAAPQVDTKWRIFTTQLPLNNSSAEETTDEKNDKNDRSIIRIFINPEIIDHSRDVTFGPDPDDPVLEGCLSIPGLYGPVPRWEHVTLQYQEVIGDQLETRTEKFSDFAARVVQHEYDHLNGVLFIDYSLSYDLPIYKESGRQKKLYEIEKELLLPIARELPKP